MRLRLGIRSWVFCLVAVLLARPALAQTLRIYTIDVEQADAALLVMPNGKTLLIDSGKNGHGRRVKAAMDRAGVTQIDAFVASHYHEDHYGGIDDLVNLGVPVLEAYDRGDKQFVSADTKAQKTYQDYQQTVGEDAKPLRRGDTISLDPSVTITCLGAGGVVMGETGPVTADEENDMSISLLITFNGFRAYFGGDTEEPTEVKLAAHHLAKDVDFYKSSHHGSHSSSSPAFLLDMMPSVIVVSNGSTAKYKHPRRVTLDAYAALPTPPLVLQTNKCLLSAPCANVANQFIADPELTDEDGNIETTVDAASHTFTVKWRSESRTMPIRAAASASPTSTSGIVISELLPNPAGADEQLETVTLRNDGTTSVSLAGWILRDRSGLVWTLSGSLAPSTSRTFRRNGQPMSLNNAGDEISLLDPTQARRDLFTYTSSAEGVVIKKS